jgi:hypothetical protein
MPVSLRTLAALNIGTAGVSSFSASTTGLTPSTGTTGAVTLAGTLSTGNGGTGVTDGRTAINNLEGYQAYNTSGGSLTLTSSSAKNIILTNTNISVFIPVANTLSNGHTYTITLLSPPENGVTSATLSISGGGGQIATIPNNSIVQAMVVGGAWQVRNVGWTSGLLTTQGLVSTGYIEGATISATDGIMQVFGTALGGGPEYQLFSVGSTYSWGIGMSTGTDLLNFYSQTKVSDILSLGGDGVIYKYQPEPTSKSAAATLTIAELRTGIIRYTGSNNQTLTLPTGTNIENGVSGIAVDLSFEFDVINTGTATATIGTASGLTLIGAMSVTTGTSGVFRVRKTATNTFTVYRLG